MPCDVAFGARRHVVRSSVPFVIADRIPDDPNADTVAVDNTKAAFEGAMMLFRKGHLSLLTVASDMRTANIAERYAGIRAAADAFGSGVEVSVLEVGIQPDAMRPLISDRLTRAPGVTAMFSLTNLATYGCFSVLSERGVAIPDKMALLGFDDYAWMAVTTPAISTVRQPVSEMAEYAWAALMARLRDPALPPRAVLGFPVR